MAKRYYGDFRSTDTTADPKGQKYRVVIFTGYQSGVVPYEYMTLTRPNPHGPDYYIGRVPKNNYSITMSDAPFVTNMEGDTDNIYKPYRCSTATVSFLQSQFNPDFINSNGTSTLVVLLKWKNSVQTVNGHLYDASTGGTLYKHIVQDSGEFPFVWYNDYDPDAYDNFCYTVEWVGFSTPETYSMDYSHTSDVFTLNCQDALSVLQYDKYKWIGAEETNTLTTFKDIILNLLQPLGTYRKVYVTDTLKFIENHADLLTLVYAQQRNNYDEDGKPTDKLDVLSRLLTYLNLTAIPYKNTLVITTPNAIADNWHNYNVYALPDNGYILNFSESDTYTAQPSENMCHNYTVTGESYAQGGTSISTNSVYNSVTASVDNYEVGDLMPDIEDTDKFIAEQTARAQYFSETVTQGNETVTNYYAWEYKNVTPPANGKITLKHYNTDTFGGVWNNVELDYSPSVAEWSKPGCYIIEHSGAQQTSTANTLPLNSHYGRDYWFNAARFIDGDVYVTRSDYMHNKANYWQPMLVFDSDNVLMFAGDNLNICGEWTFYCAKDHDTFLAPYTFYNKEAKSRAHTGQLNTLYNYVFAKVRVADKWLSNTGDTYYWVPNETWVRLYIDWYDGKLAFSTPYEFKQTNRNIKGTCIPLPVEGNDVLFGNIHIELDRPIGTYYYACTSALLKDYSVKVITVDDTPNRNIEFKTEINSDNVADYDIKCAIGSQHTNGALWSEIVKYKNGIDVERMTSHYNVATGNYHLPEQHITTNAANQYAQPTINLQMSLRDELTPYSLVTWSQLNGRKFIVNSSETDYANNVHTVTLTEVKPTTQRTTVRRNTTRNYRRNDDLIFNENRVVRANPVTLVNTDTSVGGSFYTYNNSVQYTSNDETEQTFVTTLQPNFDACSLQVSVPNDIDDIVAFSVDADGLHVDVG